MTAGATRKVRARTHPTVVARRGAALLALAVLAGPARAENAALDDLFRGERAEIGLIERLRACTEGQPAEVGLACRYTENDPCIDVGTDPDICFLREAAAWDALLEPALAGARDRLVDDWEDEDAADRLDVAQAAWRAWRAAECAAAAHHWRETPAQQTREYTTCLIDLTAARVMALTIWGEI